MPDRPCTEPPHLWRVQKPMPYVKRLAGTCQKCGAQRIFKEVSQPDAKKSWRKG